MYCTKEDRCPKCLKINYKRAVKDYQDARTKMLQAAFAVPSEGVTFVDTTWDKIESLMNKRVQISKAYRRWQSKIEDRMIMDMVSGHKGAIAEFNKSLNDPAMLKLTAEMEKMLSSNPGCLCCDGDCDPCDDCCCENGEECES